MRGCLECLHDAGNMKAQLKGCQDKQGLQALLCYAGRITSSFFCFMHVSMMTIGMHLPCN